MSLLDDWINKEAQYAAIAMLRAISATDLVKERPGFGQRIIPHVGSVLASPVRAAYDPDPDYFFHWFRDSAVVIDALRVAFSQGLIEEKIALTKLKEFVDFTRALQNLDGTIFLRHQNYVELTQPTFYNIYAPKKKSRSSATLLFLEKHALILMENLTLPAGRALKQMDLHY